MKTNVGIVDRVIRVIIGLIGLYLGITISPWFYILAAVGIGTALIGWCGLYSLIGINTCKIK